MLDLLGERYPLVRTFCPDRVATDRVLVARDHKAVVDLMLQRPRSASNLHEAGTYLVVAREITMRGSCT